MRKYAHEKLITAAMSMKKNKCGLNSLPSDLGCLCMIYKQQNQKYDRGKCLGLSVTSFTWRPWRTWRANRSVFSWNSQEVVFFRPLYTSCKSRTAQKHIPIFKRQKQANPRRIKDVKQHCMAQKEHDKDDEQWVKKSPAC